MSYPLHNDIYHIFRDINILIPSKLEHSENHRRKGEGVLVSITANYNVEQNDLGSILANRSEWTQGSLDGETERRKKRRDESAWERKRERERARE